LVRDSIGVLDPKNALPSTQVEVDVLGKRFTFRTAYAAEQVHSAADYINQTAQELRRQFPSASLPRISVLVLMQIAHELLTLRREYQSLKEGFERESERLLRMMTGQ